MNQVKSRAVNLPREGASLARARRRHEETPLEETSFESLNRHTRAWHPENASMSNARDILADPLGFVQQSFTSSLGAVAGGGKPTDGDHGVSQAVRMLIEDGASFDSIPEINACGGVETIKPNTLVRFRALVQDMYEPEYYVGAYRDKSTGAWMTTKYTEAPAAGVDIGDDSALFERRVMYCVPVPAEREWVRESEFSVKDGVNPDSSNPKRARDGDEMDVCDDHAAQARSDVVKPMFIRPDIEHVHKTSAADRLAPDTPEQIGDGEPREESLDQLLNFPIVPESRTPCIVKLYGESDEGLKLNDVVEFVGLVHYAVDSFSEDSRDEQMDEAMKAFYATSSFAEEDAAKNPASSLVPRFHALAYKVTSQNLFVDSTPSQRFMRTDLEAQSAIASDQVQSVRGKILDMISNALGGDAFAAEVVLMAIISRVHTRTDLLTLGKVSLNLTGCRSNAEASNVPELLSSVISKICPSVAHLSMTVPSLNARPWTPRKDYVYNRLRSGPLQLAASTVLVLDECRLEAGTLTANGVRNVEALKSLSATQEVEYDFEYHQMRVQVDIPLIILSDTKSIVPTDLVVPLRQVRDPIATDVSDDELQVMRKFITSARMMKHFISEETSAEIEAEIVSARKADNALSQTDLHMMLTMARLQVLSKGSSEVTKQTWKDTVEMSRRIQERIRVVE
jgi:hypothetical protein